MGDNESQQERSAQRPKRSGSISLGTILFVTLLVVKFALRSQAERDSSAAITPYSQATPLPEDYDPMLDEPGGVPAASAGEEQAWPDDPHEGAADLRAAEAGSPHSDGSRVRSVSSRCITSLDHHIWLLPTRQAKKEVEGINPFTGKSMRYHPSRLSRRQARFARRTLRKMITEPLDKDCFVIRIAKGQTAVVVGFKKSCSDGCWLLESKLTPDFCEWLYDFAKNTKMYVNLGDSLSVPAGVPHQEKAARVVKNGEALCQQLGMTAKAIEQYRRQVLGTE